MIKLNKNILRQALDVSPLATVIVDLQGSLKKIAYVNQAFEALSGFESSELLGHPWEQLLNTGNSTADELQEVVEVNCHERLGATTSLQLEILPLFDRPGTPRYWVATERQVPAGDGAGSDGERESLIGILRDARMHLRRLDGRDSVTGLLSRRAFDDILQRDWVLAQRQQRGLGLMVLQLDGFAGYREVYGRHAADSCLGKVAHAITGTLRRNSDLAARLGDDQFAVLVAEGDAGKLAILATTIAAKVRGLSIHHPRSPVDRFVTVSFGVATMVPSNSAAYETLIEEAQQQLASNPALDHGLTAI